MGLPTDEGARRVAGRGLITSNRDSCEKRKPVDLGEGDAHEGKQVEISVFRVAALKVAGGAWFPRGKRDVRPNSKQHISLGLREGCPSEEERSHEKSGREREKKREKNTKKARGCWGVWANHKSRKYVRKSEKERNARDRRASRYENSAKTTYHILFLEGAQDRVGSEGKRGPYGTRAGGDTLSERGT